MAEDPAQILRSATTVVVVDWPSRDVPASLARAGLVVLVHGGPTPEDWSAYELRDGDVVARHVGAPPAQADIVYTHRPIDELPGITDMARGLSATVVWLQSGDAGPGVKDPAGCWLAAGDANRARQIVVGAGLRYLDQPYIGEVARGLR